MDEALTLRDLHFGYGSRAAVRGVSLSLSTGDCYGFLGHNGAGKTTVMRLCLGLLRPARGDVRVFGIDPTRQRRRANALLGALIERPGFHAHVTARRNLAWLAQLQGIPHRLASAEVGRVLECVGLRDAAERRVGTFSMGMRQRLGIAQALLGGPRLLLLDEPTNGLDPEGIADLRALLLRLTRDEQVAVMLSSHQLAELEGLCNRVGVLREGAMVVEGDLATLRRRTGARHAVTGPSLPALQTALEDLDLAPTRDGERLLVDLGERPPHEVTRALAQAAELSSFAPEQATLERIYLQADRAALPTPEAPPAKPPTAIANAPTPRLGRADRGHRRAFAYEARALLQKRTTLPLLLLPCAIAVFAVRSYSQGVEEGLLLVEQGQRFSADAGSGYLAVAQSLQSATPALAVALLWLASQTIAADVSADTLRNVLTRSLRRSDVLLGKVSVLLAALLAGWLAVVVTSVVASWSTVGFGDLEEVTRFGDRDLLAAAADVGPTMWIALGQVMLPLAAIVSVAAATSAAARRPALALAAAGLVALVPELARRAAGEHAGWLLTSHLPVLWRDDSALGYLAATARGAADALWRWSDVAVLAPLAWFGAGLVVLAVVLQRMKVR